ncbi:hypothetical protein PSP6_960015 [Paraburkholderia tropica]|nr:hypothetical protein PSP6_960015 [Paraburkholderia tropica]
MTSSADWRVRKRSLQCRGRRGTHRTPRALKTLDEKKPAAVSGLNPYQEETWRRQESLYTAV